MHAVGVVVLFYWMISVISAATGGKGRSAGWNAVLLLRLFVAFIALLLGTVGESPWWMVTFFATLVLPAGFCRCFLVPLGLPYVCFWFQRIVHFGMGESDAVFYELLARHRWGLRLHPGALRSLQRQNDRILELQRGDDALVEGSTLASSAMFLGQAGDLDGARVLLRTVIDFRRRDSSFGVASFAHGWLLADAFSRDHHDEVLRLCELRRRSAQSMFFRRLVRREVSWEGSQSSHFLRFLSALQTCPTAGRRLLRARAIRPTPEIDFGQIASFEDLKNLTVHVFGRPVRGISRKELRLFAAHWDCAIEDGQVRKYLDRYAEQWSEFEMTTAEAQYLEEVRNAFCRSWRAAPSDDIETIGDAPSLIAAAAEEEVDELLTIVEEVVYDTPVDEDPQELDLERRWRDWATVKCALERLEEVDSSRARLAISQMQNRLTNHAVWLFNERSAKFLGGEIFVWLYERTTRGDELRQLLADNKKAAER